MNANCESFNEWVRAFSLINSCETLPNGYLRLATPFLYPDGSCIDLFYRHAGEFFTPDHLTDLGQTSAYLADLHVFPSEHPRRARILSAICKNLNVENLDGELRAALPNEMTEVQAFQRALPNAFFRLAEACVRVSDLSFTKRFKIPSSFNEQIGSFLSVATDVRYEANVKVPGKYDKNVRVDFRTAIRGTENLILTISPETRAGAHSASAEVFSKWHLLEPRKGKQGFITLLDAQSVQPRLEDIKLLEEQSAVVMYPEQKEQLRSLLAA